MDTTPKKRRRIVIQSLLVDRSGQYVALPIQLPANAARITGVMVTANQQRNILTAYTGWVIYGPPGAVPGTVQERWLDATQYNRLPGGLLRLSSDPNNPQGFQLTLSDEVALARLRPAPGQTTYVFCPKILGTARFVNQLNQEILPVAAPKEFLAADGGYNNPHTLCYELPVDAQVFFPPSFII
jgi:hypothetical protein